MKRFVVSAIALAVTAIALALAFLAWPTGTAGQGDNQMANCPQAGKWSIAVWDGPADTDAETALGTCATTIDAAFALDPDTQLFSRYFRGRPEVSNLEALGELQGVLALGGAATTAAGAEVETLSAAQNGQMVNCPQAGKWSIAVWDGPADTDAETALDTCATSVDAAFALDPDTQLFSRFFRGRPEVSNLSTLDEHQGVLARGAAGAPAPISLGVDESITPALSELPAHDDGAPRPVASIMDPSGIQADFVADELIIVTDDQAELNAFLARWEGEILSSFDPADAGLTVKPWYLVRINTDLADAAALEADLRSFESEGQGDHRVSSQQGLDLLAAWAGEEADGRDVDVNWVGSGHNFRNRTTLEALLGPPGYSRNAFDWPFLDAGSAQDIGVAEAWRALDLAGRLGNKVRIAIVDGGFATQLSGTANEDFPLVVATVGAMNRVNAGTCGGAPCPWHGTGVVGAAMGVPDNEFGGAGPAGPVAEAILVQLDSNDIHSAAQGLVDAYVNRPKIINMSFGGRTVALGTSGCSSFNDLTEDAYRHGVLLFAAAGNNNENVDDEDCVLGCWEEAWHWPCENDGVICVGALAWNSRDRADYSNYGRNEVRTYAPGTVWVGPNPDSPTMDRAQFFGGTSAASPFAAGVAALIWAADPSLTNGEVWANMFRNRGENWIPNAYDSVIDALGFVPSHPEITITSPADGSSHRRLTDIVQFRAEATDAEDGPLTGDSIVWTLGAGGDEIGTGTAVNLWELPFCRHTVVARATDSDGYSTSDVVRVWIVPEPPMAEISSPNDGDPFFENQHIQLRGRSRNLNHEGGPELDDDQVSWDVDGTALDTGHEIEIPGDTLSPGTHTITFTANKGFFRCHGAPVPGVPDPLEQTASIDITILETPSEDEPPDHVLILLPANGESFWADEYDSVAGLWYKEVILFGGAHDPEDGNLTGSSLTWTTSMDGLPPNPIATGGTSTGRLYAKGGCAGTTHEITLTATDSAGNPGTDSVTVYVLLIC